MQSPCISHKCKFGHPTCSCNGHFDVHNIWLGEFRVPTALQGFQQFWWLKLPKMLTKLGRNGKTWENHHYIHYGSILDLTSQSFHEFREASCKRNLGCCDKHYIGKREVHQNRTSEESLLIFEPSQKDYQGMMMIQFETKCIAGWCFKRVGDSTRKNYRPTSIVEKLPL